MTRCFIPPYRTLRRKAQKVRKRRKHRKCPVCHEHCHVRVEDFETVESRLPEPPRIIQYPAAVKRCYRVRFETCPWWRNGRRSPLVPIRGRTARLCGFDSHPRTLIDEMIEAAGG